jgi:hypothetical protein
MLTAGGDMETALFKSHIPGLVESQRLLNKYDHDFYMAQWQKKRSNPEREAARARLLMFAKSYYPKVST